MGIQGTINDTFSFKKSAKGVADVGRDYLSQAIEVIACCRKIDTKNNPKLIQKQMECVAGIFINI